MHLSSKYTRSAYAYQRKVEANQRRPRRIVVHSYMLICVIISLDSHLTTVARRTKHFLIRSFAPAH